MKYRKKPVVIEAVQWNGTNRCEIEDFAWGRVHFLHNLVHSQYPQPFILQISTLEGVMTASVGDFIIKGVKGEIYACKPDVFEMTYEAAP